MTDRRGFLLRIAGLIGLGVIAARCVGPDVTPVVAAEVNVGGYLPAKIMFADGVIRDFPVVLREMRRRRRRMRA